MDSHPSLSVSDQSPSLPETSSIDHNLVNGSENVGFHSGEDDDDLETEPTRPILVYPHANSPKVGGAVDDPFLNSADFFTPKSQMPIAKVTLDDEDDDDDVSEEDEEEHDSHGVVLEQGDKLGEAVKDGGFVDSNEEEVFVDAPGSDSDKGFESGDFEGVAAVENGVELHDDLKNEKKKDEEVVVNEEEEESNGILHDRQLADGVDNTTLSDETGNSHSLVVESAHDDDKSNPVVDDDKSKPVDDDKSKPVVDDDNDGDDVVNFNSSGDSLVDTVQVNVLGSEGGVAVVGDKVEQVEVSEIEGVEAPTHGVGLDNGFDPIEQHGGEDVFDNKVADGDAESGQIVDTGVGDDTGHGQKSDIAPLEKDESSEFASHNVKAVQDDMNVADHADEGETGRYIEASGEDDEEGHGDREIDGAVLDRDGEGMNFGSSDVPKKYSEEQEEQPGVGQIVDTGVDDDTGHEQKGDIAPLEKDESSEFASYSVKAVQDDKNIEVHADEGETGRYIEASGEDDEEGHGDREIDGAVLDREGEGMNFGSFDVPKKYSEEQEEQPGVGQIVDTGVDDDTGHEQKGDIAPLEKDESSEFASHSVKAVQDDKNIEVHADEGETGRYIEASGEDDEEDGLDAEDVFYNKVEVGNAESRQIVDTGVDDDTGHGQKTDIAPLEKDKSSESASHSVKAVQDDMTIEGHADEGETGRYIEASGEDDEEEEEHCHIDNEIDGSVLDREGEGMNFGSSDAPEKYFEEQEEQPAVESSRDQRIDGQIVTDSDEEVDTDDEGDGKELFDTATLAALLKAASGAGQDGGGITITSQDGSRLFSVERPAGLGPSLQSGKPAMRSNRANIFTPSISRAGTDSDNNLSKEEKDKLEKLQQIRIKFLRLVQRLGFTTEESIAAQVLYRMTLVAGRQTGQIFSLDAASESASQLEAEGRDDLDYSINVLVLGKTGVGKSATINSIFGETKTSFSAYGPSTTAVTEIVGMVDGVKIRVFDTPGLKSSALEQSFNRKVLSMIKKATKKSPPDIVLYVDRLDLQTRDLNDLPLLRSITSALGPSIWRNVIVTLTHGASAPPDGPSGSPLGYDVFVAQRSHIVQQTIGQAVGDLRLMNPSLMNPVSLVENHPSCRKNRDGQKVLPNGQSWRPLLLLLCYSMKILSEASNLSKTQESFDHRRLFGFRSRSPPLPYLLSWLLQSRAHPKLLADQGGVDNGDSDIEMADLSDSDLDEDEDEYDQLPPFKPLKKSQIAKLNREQQKAYLEEYDYRVKLLQKKQWREELRRMREMKKKGKPNVNDYGYTEDDDQENGSPAAVPVPLPDMALPPSFDSDNPAYRYRFLEPTSQLLTRPVLDTHSWDHDCGYDGVNLEHSLAIINQFPAAVTVQITKDKKDFSIHLDSSVAAKHGDSGSTMAGFDIQNIGKQLAYIVRGETKFKNYKRNKTAAGLSVTFLGENVSTGLKVEDQIALGKRLVLVGSTGTVRCQGDSVYGANVEVRLREADFPIGQDQSSLSLSLVKWRGDLALGANFQSQFSIGRSYKMGVRAGLNNKLSGQISVRTSSSDQLQIALLAILPVARAIYKNFWPGASENYSIY